MCSWWLSIRVSQAVDPADPCLIVANLTLSLPCAKARLTTADWHIATVVRPPIQLSLQVRTCDERRRADPPQPPVRAGMSVRRRQTVQVPTRQNSSDPPKPKTVSSV